MLSFTAAPYTFEVDGETYSLPRFSIDFFDGVSDLIGLEPKEQIRKFAEFMVKHAENDETAEIISKLAFRDVSVLFQDWSTMKGAVTPGESQGSAS